AAPWSTKARVPAMNAGLTGVSSLKYIYPIARLGKLFHIASHTHCSLSLRRVGWYSTSKGCMTSSSVDRDDSRRGPGCPGSSISLRRTGRCSTRDLRAAQKTGHIEVMDRHVKEDATRGPNIF